MKAKSLIIFLFIAVSIPNSLHAHDIVKDVGEISKTQTIMSYISIGFQHILPLGFDHILFIISLVLLNHKPKDLLLLTATFTVGHCITLAIASLKIATMPANIVEPFIAATIVLTAISILNQNQMGRFQLPIIFAFGLIHGLGFAGALAEIGLTQNQFLLSILSFNVGLEIGQITIVFTSFLLIKMAKKWLKISYRAITVPISIGIMLVGIFWIVERIG